MSGDGERRGVWIWRAGGAAIVDHARNVRNIVLLGTRVLTDEDAVKRMVRVLKSVKRRMELFQPSGFCEDGDQLNIVIDDAIARWHRLHPAQENEQAPNDRSALPKRKPTPKYPRKWPRKR